MPATYPDRALELNAANGGEEPKGLKLPRETNVSSDYIDKVQCNHNASRT